MLSNFRGLVDLPRFRIGHGLGGDRKALGSATPFLRLPSSPHVDAAAASSRSLKAPADRSTAQSQSLCQFPRKEDTDSMHWRQWVLAMWLSAAN